MNIESVLSHDLLVDIYVEAWNTLNTDLLEPVMDDNFRYGSMWVLSDLVGKQAYLDYIKGKFEAIKTSHSIVRAQRGISPQTGLARVELLQDGHRGAKIDVKSNNGVMTSAYMHDL